MKIIKSTLVGLGVGIAVVTIGYLLICFFYWELLEIDWFIVRGIFLFTFFVTFLPCLSIIDSDSDQ